MQLKTPDNPLQDVVQGLVSLAVGPGQESGTVVDHDMTVADVVVVVLGQCLDMEE